MDPRIAGYIVLGAVALTVVAGVVGFRRAKAAELRSIELDRAGRWLCARCDSAAVERLPPNQVTRHPGYSCRACGLRMRPRGSTVKYVLVLLLALVFTGVAVAVIVLSGEKDIRISVAMTIVPPVVAFYSIRQLFRPMQRHVDDVYPDPSAPL